MRTHPPASRRAVAVLTAASFILSQAAPLLASPMAGPAQGQVAGPPKPKATPAPPPPSTANGVTVTPPADGGWPRAYATPSGGKIVIYQPQVASWDEQRHVVAYAAVSYETKGATKPALGSVKIEADTKVAVSERLVNFSDVQDHRVQLPDAAQGADAGGGGRDRQGDPGRRPRDRPRPRAGHGRPQPDHARRTSTGVKADPPTIFFSKKPAVLVNLDGEPIWSPIKENDLKFAVNTNWDLFQHDPTKIYYLRNEQSWLQAQDAQGPVDRGRQAAGELRASSRATTTGRTSRRPCPARRSPRTSCRRCSSAPRRPR